MAGLPCAALLPSRPPHASPPLLPPAAEGGFGGEAPGAQQPAAASAAAEQAVASELEAIRAAERSLDAQLEALWGGMKEMADHELNKQRLYVTDADVMRLPVRVGGGAVEGRGGETNRRHGCGACEVPPRLLALGWGAHVDAYSSRTLALTRLSPVCAFFFVCVCGSPCRRATRWWR